MKNKKLYNLREMLNLLDGQVVIKETNFTAQDNTKEVLGLTFDSREVKKGSIFVCKGAHFDEKYLVSAFENGAIAYVSEKKYDINAPYIIVNDIRKSMAILADAYYNSPWKQLTTIGLTGTKGKSTTAYFLKYILDDYQKTMKKSECGILSSIENYDGVINEESHLTTPEAIPLQRHFSNAVKSGIDYFIMEVSSQALKYDRTYGILYDVAAFLNIGEDHISSIEHSDYRDYFESKLILLNQCKTLVLNKNNNAFDEVLEMAKFKGLRTIICGTDSECDIYGYNITPMKSGIKFTVKSDAFCEEFKIKLHGIFNVDNALTAIGICYVLNIPLLHIKAGLKKAQVSGRMEIFTNKAKDLNVVVDYAHNKMSFQSLFESMSKEFPGKRLNIVFGCPGKKALLRRKELGEIAGKYSNMVYLTEEDAGEEAVLEICKEIATHVAAQDCDYEIIPDRREAIRRAIDDADSNTVVLVTGKGRETRQKRGTEYIDTPSDVDYVCEFLKYR